MVWAEMVMGRNGHGPKWLWAEMTSDQLRNTIIIVQPKYLYSPYFQFIAHPEDSTSCGPDQLISGLFIQSWGGGFRPWWVVFCQILISGAFNHRIQRNFQTAEAIHTTVVSIRILIRTTVVPITTVVRIRILIGTTGI